MGWHGFRIVLVFVFSFPVSAQGAGGWVQGPGANLNQVTSTPVGELSCTRGLSTQILQGTIVGRSDTLLTVGHVLDGETPEPGVLLKGCIFKLFDENGRPSFESRVRMVSRPSKPHASSYALDWAILRLESRAPVAPAQFADFHSALGLEYHSLAYFSRKRGRRYLQIASQCSARPVRPRSIVLKHDCPSWKGTSGSPLIASFRNGFKVVGVQAKAGGYAVGLAGWPLEELRKATAVD